MNKFTFFLAAISILAVGLIAAKLPQAAAAKSPFVGAWESTDIDGSHQQVNIGGNGSKFHVVYQDKAASLCGVDPDTGEILYRAQFQAKASAVGDVLTTELATFYCMASPPFVLFEGSLEFTYDSGTDTLTNWVVWTRK